jgi:hypothetical protein
VVPRQITWKAFRKGKEKELLRLTDVDLKGEIAQGRRRSESKTTRLERLEATEDYAAKRAGSLVLDRDFSSAMRFYKTMFIAASAATSWKCTRAVSMIFSNLPSVPWLA